MADVVPLLKEKVAEVLRAMLPLVGIVVALQLGLVHAPSAVFVQFVVGSLLAIVGMVLIFIGVEIGILPLGRFIGAELPRKGSLMLIVAVSFSLGFATTVAEPDVLVLAQQVDVASDGAISERSVLYVIALGVGVFAALAMARIIWGVALKLLLALAFGAALAVSFVAPPGLRPMADDAGRVETRVLTTPGVLS